MALINEEAQMKELKLQNLKYASGSEVAINFSDDFLRRLQRNFEEYFYIISTINRDKNYNGIIFSPRQALNICNKCLTLLFNRTYSPFAEITIPLTKGYCKIVSNTKKENMKLLFIDNSMNRILYQINSVKEIGKLLSWLKEILQIGGYITENEVKPTKQNQSIEFIIDNIKGTTECYIDGELKGKTIANPKEEIDDRMGKLVSFIRALEFDKDTEKRIINNLFITEDVIKLKEKNKKLEKQRTDLINTNGRIKDKLSETYLEIVHDINNAILFNRN